MKHVHVYAARVKLDRLWLADRFTEYLRCTNIFKLMASFRVSIMFRVKLDYICLDLDLLSLVQCKTGKGGNIP